jgi:hypothetical protein
MGDTPILCLIPALFVRVGISLSCCCNKLLPCLWIIYYLLFFLSLLIGSFLALCQLNGVEDRTLFIIAVVCCFLVGLVCFYVFIGMNYVMAKIQVPQLIRNPVGNPIQQRTTVISGTWADGMNAMLSDMVHNGSIEYSPFPMCYTYCCCLMLVVLFAGSIVGVIMCDKDADNWL